MERGKERNELSGFLLRIITAIYQWMSRVSVNVFLFLILVIPNVFNIRITTGKHELIFEMYEKNRKQRDRKMRTREQLDYHKCICILIQQQWFLPLSVCVSIRFSTHEEMMHIWFNLFPYRFQFWTHFAFIYVWMDKINRICIWHFWRHNSENNNNWFGVFLYCCCACFNIGCKVMEWWYGAVLF